MSFSPLREFLQTGALHGVAVGASADGVAAQFGPPAEASRVRRGLVLWAYAGRLVQVTVERGRVVLIGLYPRHASTTTDDPLQGGFPIAGIDRAALAAKLEEWGISWSVSPRSPSMYEVGAHRVLAIFGEDGVLESLQVASGPPPGASISRASTPSHKK